MKRRLTIHLTNIFLIAACLCACSTISRRQSLNYPFPAAPRTETFGKKPVDIDSELESKHLTDPGNDVLLVQIRYQQAKLWGEIDPAKACALWGEVLSRKHFPLLNVARIHAAEVCPAGQLEGLPSIAETINEPVDPWLRELLLRSALKRAVKAGDKKNELTLSEKVADYEKVNSDRVRLLQRAVDLAKGAGDTESLNKAQTLLEDAAPHFIVNPTKAQLPAVAADFKKSRQFENARSIYRSIVADPEASDIEKLSALDGIRMSFKLENKSDEFLKATREYASYSREHFLLPGLKTFKSNREQAKLLLARYLDAQIVLARAVWTDGSPLKAREILLAAERRVKRKVSLAESVFTRARIAEEAGDFATTLSLLSAIDLSDIGSRDLKTKVLWYKAWNLRKAARLDEAAKALQTLVTEDDTVNSTASRNRFWYAKTLLALKRDADAKEQFEWLIEKDRAGWYGLLSFRELGRPFPALGQGRGPAAFGKTESSLFPDETLLFEWLTATGEQELALGFLDQTMKDRSGGLSESQLVDLLQLYARAGSFQSVFNRIQELPIEARTSLLDSHPELMFPQPWTQIVQPAAMKFDVQSELIYAIMRQESAFNPYARSGADAFGLMQLIPDAARLASSTAGVEFNHHEELYTPETNIPLGASFIKTILKRWNGEFIPTVASYNASDKAIAGWIKSRYRGDVLEFIEDIPYEETRTYIKLVMRNYVFYRRLNSGQTELAFPEWCLSALHADKS